MRKHGWYVWLMIMLWCVALPVSAQSDADRIALSSFVNTHFSVQGMRPQSWSEDVPNSGVYRRDSERGDRTVLLIQSSDGTHNQVLNAIASQYRLTSTPSVRRVMTMASFDWSIYKLEDDIGADTLHVDLALAVHNDLVYLILMQTSDDSYDQLHEDVFLTVLNTVTPIDVTAVELLNADSSSDPSWRVTQDNEIMLWVSGDDTASVYLTTVEGDDAETAINDFAQLFFSDADLTSDAVIQIDDDTVGTVTIVDYDTGTSDRLLRGAAHIIDGVVYVSLFDSTESGFERYTSDLEVLAPDIIRDRLLPVDDIVPNDEATDEPVPEVTAEVTDEAAAEVTPEATEPADE